MLAVQEGHSITASERSSCQLALKGIVSSMPKQFTALKIEACCVEYIILESDNLSALFPNAHLDIAGIHLGCHKLFAIVITLAILPTTWLRDLSILSYLSAGGVVASLVAVGCLFWVASVDKIGVPYEGHLINLGNLPVALGLYGYCYSGHAVYPNIYTSMKRPSQFSAVLVLSFIICTTMYGATAIVGYKMFGDLTLSQFTLNMPKQFTASKIAVWTTVVNPFTKYALTMTPVAMSLEELLPTNTMKSHLYSIAIRTMLVFSSFAVAVTIPFFDKQSHTKFLESNIAIYVTWHITKQANYQSTSNFLFLTGIIYEVVKDIAAWPGREMPDESEPLKYFGINTARGLI